MNSGVINVLGFWVFLLTFTLVDYSLYDKGHDSFFWKHVSPEEKELQRIAINKARGECK